MIKLREVDRNEWNTLWLGVVHANLLQSWEYGEAKSSPKGWRAVRFVAETELGEPVALMQLLVREWPIVGGMARLNRGPLLVNLSEATPGDAEKVLHILETLLNEARKRRWWVLYVAPELELKDVIHHRLTDIGMRLRRTAPWASSMLSLSSAEEVLFSGLNGKWRNLLRKSQKAGLSLKRFSGDREQVDLLIERYRSMQSEKGFVGIPEGLLKKLAQQGGTNWKFNLYVSTMGKTSESSGAFAGLLVSIVHGDTATYLIGCTDESARMLNVNYLLLWHAINDARELGCKWFDLGGVNANTPPGVAHFKNGLNGVRYSLIGEYWALNV